MKKFTQILEKKVANIKGGFTKDAIEKFLKEHGEIDIVTNKDDRFFIAPFMHVKGKMSQANDIAFTTLDKTGKQKEILYTDIKSIEY
jgi:hypothetical protein